MKKLNVDRKEYHYIEKDIANQKEKIDLTMLFHRVILGAMIAIFFIFVFPFGVHITFFCSLLIIHPSLNVSTKSTFLSNFHRLLLTNIGINK